MPNPRGNRGSPAQESAQDSPVATREAAAEWVPVGDLRPWAQNPRRNEGEPVRKVAESIRRFGFGAPILARTSNHEIIAGHTRWLAAKELGLERVPVRFLDLDPADAKLLALADNRIAEEAAWDDDRLAAVLAELREGGADVLAAGFDEGEIDRLLAGLGAGPAEEPESPEAQVSRADELRAKWATEPGQIWEVPSAAARGKVHRIVCGDSRSVADVERVMQGERADCLWSDPPYGVAYVGKTADALTLENDRLSAGELFELLAAAFATADQVVLKRGAALYVAHPAGALSLQFHLAFEQVGWRIHQGLVWVKDRFALGHGDYHMAHEPILHGYVPGEGRRGRGGEGWYGDNAQSSVFAVDRPSVNELHPTMKPIALIAPMLRNSAPAGGLVFEPFSGSGSTMVACESTGRVCRAVEIDPKYVAVSLERMSAMGREPARA